jgi:poly-gamma-glutamate synthesis protein (capsule biosynthesis protein)
VHDARDYVALAESASGPIRRPVPPGYLWGAAFEYWRRFQPDLRIVNLETAVTTSNTHWPGKRIHYRMHPDNVNCLTAAKIDCCGLANNHVLDWGRSGLLETLDTLHAAGIATAGAGRNRDEALQPAVFPLPGGRRVLVFAVGSRSSGIPADWAAGDQRPGLQIVDESEPSSIEELQQAVARTKSAGDFVVVSIHWGENWGYEIPTAQGKLAHRLIDDLGADVVHGHSSHHVKAVELYRGRPILYGCGDFLTDYEGIVGHAEYRGNLAVMFFVTLHGDEIVWRTCG